MNKYRELTEAIDKHYKEVTHQFEQKEISEEQYLQELVKIDSDLDKLLAKIKLEQNLRKN